MKIVSLRLEQAESAYNCCCLDVQKEIPVEMAKPLIATKPVSTVAASAARLSITSGVLFVLLLGSLHLLEPEFDPTWRFISEYALGNFGWLMRLAFLALATSLAGASVAILSQIRTVAGYIGLVGLGIAAIGFLIAAIFTTDLATTSRDAATFSGKMHVFGASLDYTPVAALLLSFSLARNETWRPIRKRLFITAIITLLVLTAFMLTLPYDGKVGPGVLAGLFGRFLLVSYVGWLVTVGIHTIKLLKQQPLSSIVESH
jgi:uncharacterized protein DUF998